ncbi:DUF4157 domain-containing protein [Microcoleus sp. D2_18a_D3]|uniref:DUF4157 domain-containing protein n=1 Tax=Microcoleus sp. D2_18a_D3 TaxID=3055330 RepID=UPI002FCE8FDB
MSRVWAQKKSGSNSSMSVQKSSSSQRPFTAPIYDAPAPKQTPSVQAKRRNVDWSRVTVEAQSPATVQAKLSVGAPGDKYEQEADAIANKVMTMPAPESEQPIQREIAAEENKEEEVQAKPLAASIAPLVQRETALEENKEEEVQTKSLAGSIQREMAPEENKEEEVQTKSLAGSIQREMAPEENQEEEPVQAKPANEGNLQVSNNIENQLSGNKGGGSPLPDDVRAFMEPRFGADFSQVRVHTGSEAVQMNQDLNAQAFTHKQDVYFGAGKTPGKDALTAHELTHVVQQTGKTSPASATQAFGISSLNEQSNFSSKLQLKHLTIEEAVDRFIDTVKPTNESPNSSTTLTNSGQFYWTNKITDGIREKLDILPSLPQNVMWQNLIAWVRSVVDEWPHGRATFLSKELQKHLAIIRTLPLSDPDNVAVIGLLDFIEPLLEPTSQTGRDIYNKLWGQLQQTDRIPNLDQYLSLPTLGAIWTWENQACGFTGNQVANRFTNKGGAKKNNPDAKRQDSTRVSTSGFASSGERDMRKLSNDFRLGDTLKQNGVGAKVPQMQKALDDGWILHARVLSGIDYGHGEHATAFDEQEAEGKPPKQPQPIGSPPEEHSIMLIGYDGDKFVFWDPDSASSNNPVPGFGCLTVSESMFSTAKNKADLPVDKEGNHNSGQHRYQIINVSSQ